MQAFAEYNDGFKYILAVIDVFSKYGWMVPLKLKTGEAVAKAFNKIFNYSKRKPEKIWVDKGKEFYNKDVKKLGVELYSTENEEKSSVVERWNRTMKEKMFKYFSANNTRRYIDVLDELVKQYNNSYHSSVKMTPVKASMQENANKVWINLYSFQPSIGSVTAKFKIGDKVRISKKKRTFEKGYTPRWTEEVFTVSAIQYTDPITYKLTDLNGEEIQGTFYEQELQKTTQEIYRIEKVLKTKGDKLYVKWFGYPESFNSWINKSNAMPLG